MEDIVKSLKAFLYDRSSSPLFGAFAISWLFGNFKIIIIAFSEGEASTKIQAINNLYEKNFAHIPLTQYYLHEQFFSWGIYPTIMALFYIFAYPIIALPIYDYSLKRNKLLRNKKLENEQARLLTEKESVEINKKIIQLEEKYNEDTSELQKKVTALNKALLEAESKIKEIEHKNFNEELNNAILTNNLNQSISDIMNDE